MLVVLLATLTFTSSAQEISDKKKAVRQERKLERQERREKKKEERAANYSNIKVTRQCTYCGHKEFYTEERKGK